jgi:hypothetical protein
MKINHESGQGLVGYAIALVLMAVVIIGLGMLLIADLDKNGNGIVDVRETPCAMYYDENGWLRNCYGNVLEPQN